MFSLVKAYVDTDANIDLDFPAALLSMRAQCLREKNSIMFSAQVEEPKNLPKSENVHFFCQNVFFSFFNLFEQPP